MGWLAPVPQADARMTINRKSEGFAVRNMSILDTGIGDWDEGFVRRHLPNPQSLIPNPWPR